MQLTNTHRTSNRRQFLSTALATIGTTFASTLTSDAATESPVVSKAPCLTGPRLIFTKGLTTWPYQQVAETIAAMRESSGISGIEAPIRPGGHIEPVKVVEELPKFVEALKKSYLEMVIMTTGLTEVDSKKQAEKQLRTAAALGIKYFRTGWYNYNLHKPIFEQLEEFKRKLTDLTALAADCGILPIYQNHSGANMVSAPIWDICYLLKDVPPERCGLAFDIMHTTLEAGKCWSLNARLALPHARALYFKDFNWVKNIEVPCALGEGAVHWKEYLGIVREKSFDGPLSLHVEYVPESKPDELVIAFKKDAIKLKELVEGGVVPP